MVFAGAIWLQMAVAPAMAVRHMLPDFVYPLIVFCAFRLEGMNLILIAFCAGMAKDLLSSSAFGLETASLVGSSVLLRYLIGQIDRRDEMVQIAATFLYALISLLFYSFLISIANRSDLIVQPDLARISGIAFYTVLITPFLFPLWRVTFEGNAPSKQYELF